jgi:hypothetical protein
MTSTMWARVKKKKQNTDKVQKQGNLYNFNNNNNNLIQFFIYLRAELNSQWLITESAHHSNKIRQHRTKQQSKKTRKQS